jgi:hypothetical protein
LGLLAWLRRRRIPFFAHRAFEITPGFVKFALWSRDPRIHSDHRIERVAGALTSGADEHVLLALAATGWLFNRSPSERGRRLGNHILACSLSRAALPHVIKRIDQKRQVD